MPRPILCVVSDSCKRKITSNAKNLDDLKSEISRAVGLNNFTLQAWDRYFEDWADVNSWDDLPEDPLKLKVLGSDAADDANPSLSPATSSVQSVASSKRQRLDSPGAGDGQLSIPSPSSSSTPSVSTPSSSTQDDAITPTTTHPLSKPRGKVLFQDTGERCRKFPQHLIRPQLVERLQSTSTTRIDLRPTEIGEITEAWYLHFVQDGTYYPKSKEYESMAAATVSALPALSKPTVEGNEFSSVSDPIATWKAKIKAKFQNKRLRNDFSADSVKARKIGRTKSTDRNNETVQTSTVPTSPMWGLDNYLPARPSGEDESSIGFWQEWLKTEARKAHPKMDLVHLRMEKTLADRRKWIVEEKPTMEAVQEAWPWLFHEQQVIREFDRMSGERVDQQLLAGLAKYGQALVAEASKKKIQGNLLKEAIQMVTKERKHKAAVAAHAALVSIPELLREDPSYFMVADKDNTECPVVLVCEDGFSVVNRDDPVQVFVEGKQVAAADDLTQAFSCFLSTFYVFNLAYPAKCSKTLTFLQKFICNFQDSTTTHKKKCFTALISKLEKHV